MHDETRPNERTGADRLPLSSGAVVSTFYPSEPNEARVWDDLVSSAPSGDVYFRPAYVRAHEAAGHGRAHALVVRADERSFLIPLLVRDLRGLPFPGQTSGYDAITAYGYGGLLPVEGSQPPAQGVVSAFQALREWCSRNQVVSVLIRLHPVFDQTRWLAAAIPQVPGLALRTCNDTTAIDLHAWSEERLSTNRRRVLARARRGALRVTWCPGDSVGRGSAIDEALPVFERIYAATMDHVEASSFYYFTPSYFRALADGLRDRLAIAIAWRGDDPVAATMFLRDGTLAHYHLNGATEAGRHMGAQTLLVREAIQWGLEHGCRYLHLGGGRTENDSLMQFKRGFGGVTFQYAYLTFVVDRDRYAALVAARRAAPRPPPAPDFFPEYRA